jgi:hypothetical protein
LPWAPLQPEPPCSSQGRSPVISHCVALRPDVWLGSVVGSGHYMALAVPDQVNAMLDRFLEVGRVTSPVPRLGVDVAARRMR